MKPSTVALLVLGVAGAGAGIYFLTRSSGGVAEIAAPPTDPRLAAIAGAAKIGVAAVAVAGKTIAAVGTGAAKAAATAVSAVAAIPAQTVTAVGKIAGAPITAVTGLLSGPSLVDQVNTARWKATEEKRQAGMTSALSGTWGAKTTIAVGG